ncbi:MAG: aspartate kinase [Holosporales bacterium]|jgi:aspartate kinase|nr:aspartate kinase [Holosporales bacterium]
MSLYVAKFGGSSVGNPTRIKLAASIIVKLIESSRAKIVVVTSAMQGVTNYLIDLARAVHDSTDHREYDAIISSGEQVAAGLLAAGLCSAGLPARSLNCWQAPIHAAGNYSNASITSIDISRIMETIEDGIIPVITGFQGLSENRDILTIGRGGSDATACAVAHAIKADECLIYTDVDGVYTADPRIVLDSKRLDEISYDEMLELAYCGAKVLQPRAVLIAKRCNVKIRVLSSFTDSGGTVVTDGKKDTTTICIPNESYVSGIAHNTNLAKLIIAEDDENYPKLLEKLGQIDLFSMNDGTVSFLFQKSSLNEIKHSLANSMKFQIITDIGLVTIVGSGFKADQSILVAVLEVANNRQIPIKQISVTENTISVIVSLHQVEELVNALHERVL